MQELKAFKDEIIRHFDVVAENIHRDVASANRDEILVLKDIDQVLDERVATIEQHLRLPNA